MKSSTRLQATGATNSVSSMVPCLRQELFPWDPSKFLLRPATAPPEKHQQPDGEKDCCNFYPQKYLPLLPSIVYVMEQAAATVIYPGRRQ
jgi:hypothetical protein